MADFSYLLPIKLKGKPLYLEGIDLINKVVTDSDVYLDDVKFKYKDATKISEDAIDSVIAEFGYDYIINTLPITREQKNVIIYHLGIIHFLKGHKRGLELVLKLMDISYTILEWWEDVDNPDPHSFTLTIDILATPSFESSILPNLKSFIAQYVYPKMKMHLTYESEADVRAGVTGVYDKAIIGETEVFGTGYGFNYGESYGDDNP